MHTARWLWAWKCTYQHKLANSSKLKQKLSLIEMWDFYFNEHMVDVVDAFNWMLQRSKESKNGCRRFFSLQRLYKWTLVEEWEIHVRLIHIKIRDLFDFFLSMISCMRTIFCTHASWFWGEFLHLPQPKHIWYSNTAGQYNCTRGFD